jgi:hypothetical protein
MKINYKKRIELWHILKEDKEKQEPPKEGLTTMRLLRHWPYARIVAHGTFIIPYVANVVITEVSWQ